MAFDVKDFSAGWSTQGPTGVPSRRSNKNRSGRAGRKQHNGQRALQRAGGHKSDVSAIYAPPIGHEDYKPLCRTVGDTITVRFDPDTITPIGTTVRRSQKFDIVELYDDNDTLVGTTLMSTK